MTPPCLTAENYTVGWVCTLPIEHAAAELMLDEKHQNPPKHVTDTNVYLLGRIGGHNVVITCLPQMGTNSAAAVASQMKSRFISIQFILMVGIGGGVPSPQADIRLGDVVIGYPNSRCPGVVQYDSGKIGPGGCLTRTGFLNAPSPFLLSALATFRSNLLTRQSDLPVHLSELVSRQERFSFEEAGLDVLFEPDYDHVEGQTCDYCSRDRVVVRSLRGRQGPVFHYGTIASGNVVMKDGVTRDSWSKELDGVLCFEMEAAGLVNILPCLVIRGICDYADSHKNKTWQPYAAATAAACAKDLLSFIPSAKAAEISPDDAQNNQCLHDLLVTDPRSDKDRIEASKDNLLKDSYTWILSDPDFLEWRNNDTRLLWIKCDPGKGKTMIMIALVRELEATLGSGTLSYFFCQSTIPELNNAVSILRGLIYLLIVKQRYLIRYLRKEYDIQGKKLFEGENVFYTLWRILSEMLDNSGLERVYLMVDALDECDSGLSGLLDIISPRQPEPFSKVKWLVASRNRPDIEERLRPDSLRLKISLELNPSHILRAVNAFIDVKVEELAKEKRYDDKIREEVRSYLSDNAEGTFLWVAVVCKELREVLRWKTRSALKGFPPRLEPLYDRIMRQIQGGKDAEFCTKILSLVTLAYRPIHLKELVASASLPEELSDDLQSLNDLVDLCGSFLTVREETIYFVHQSAKDYFSTGKGSKIFPSGHADEHRRITCRFRKLMSDTLKRNICGLQTPGTLLSEVNSGVNQDLLAPIRYACCHWVSHLRDAGHLLQDQIGLFDGGEVHIFLQNHFLHWLEALSLIGHMSDGVAMVMALESILRPKSHIAPCLFALIQDAKRFILYNRSIIERAPLQLYASALVFSPGMSLIRKRFSDQFPPWIKKLPTVEKDWSFSLQTLEGHSGAVRAVAFSPDSQLLASASRDKTVRIWDAKTGVPRGILEGHSDWVGGVAFSPDGQLLASASGDGTVRLWDAKMGASRSILEGHSDKVWAVAFLPDGQLLASTSRDKTVRLWDAKTGASRGILKGHSDWAGAVVFSPDGHLLACTSENNTVRLWDAKTGASRGILKGHSNWLYAVAFSPDGQLLAYISDNKTVRLWDAKTGASRGILEGHSGWVYAVAFSPDGQLLASASGDGTVRLWDAETRAPCSILEGHSGWVDAVAFSPDGQLLASASQDTTVRLWDTKTGASRGTLEGHSGAVGAVAFPPDGQFLASASGDKTVRLWDAKTGAPRGILEGHLGIATTVAFSPDGQLLASASIDKTVGLWDAKTGASRGVLEGHSSTVGAVAFSPDSQLLASASWDETVRLWDAKTGASRSILEGHSDWVRAVAFSPDGQLLASASRDKTVRLWDARTGVSRGILEGHSSWIDGVAFSPDGQLLASASGDGTVRLWDAKTGASHGILEGHSGVVNTVAFSPDGQLLASASGDGTVRLWDAKTGASHGILKGHSSVVNKVAFSPDGQLLASASGDGTVRLWDAKTGASHGILEGHSGVVNTVAFSPDGQLLASASGDGTVRLWDAKTGASHGILEGHSGVVNTVAFSPDGQLLASASADKTVGIWRVETREAIRDLSFSSDESHLEMSRGLLKLRYFPPSANCSDPNLCSIYVKENWVVWEGMKILWLPPDYRKTEQCAGMGSNILALRHTSGRLTFMEFDMVHTAI